MKRFVFAALLTIFAMGSAVAQETCQSKATGKDGRPLAGAALKSFMTKCSKDTCEPKAIDKNGKPLAGAAKASFMKKCESEA
jgi:opacity protein-like surface antigen